MDMDDKDLKKEKSDIDEKDLKNGNSNIDEESLGKVDGGTGNKDNNLLKKYPHLKDIDWKKMSLITAYGGPQYIPGKEILKKSKICKDKDKQNDEEK